MTTIIPAISSGRIRKLLLQCALGGINGNLCRLALKWAVEEKRNLLGLLDLLPETIEPEDYPEIEPDIQIYGIS